MTRDRFEAEFGYYTDWLVEAIDELDPSDRVPAACRGTANPELLRHLAEQLDIGAGALVLDVGSGLGGPAAWLARTLSVEVIAVDLMTQAASGARRLFPGIDVAVASTRALPFEASTFDGLWALGVIEMLADKRSAFAEMFRVLRPGGRAVLYDFVGAVGTDEILPAADRFESSGTSARLLAEVGFRIGVSQGLPRLSEPPVEWKSVAMESRALVRTRHGDDERFDLAEAERSNFNRLRARGVIEEWEFVVEKPQ